MENSLEQSRWKHTIISTGWAIILLLAFAKLAIHLLTMHNFELHRDAYLYYAQSQHLDWGYFSVPPFVAVVGKLGTSLFGTSVFALRFFPAVIGAVNVMIIGLAVRELDGRKLAIAMACLAYVLSPAYLHTNALFQPVCFDHFFWLLASFLMLKMVHREDPKMWIWIGLVLGLGFLNKYSIVFLAVAFGLALLVSRHRKLFVSKHFLWAVLVGLIIITPNLLWQHRHHWPVFAHMKELHDTQLVHVKLSGFIFDQFLMNFQALPLWLGAVFLLFFLKKEKQYRMFGWIFLFVIALLMAGSGKSYYTLGIYPILFVFGAFFAEKYIRRYRVQAAVFLVINMLVSLYMSLSFDGIPFISFEKALKKEAYRWEDGKNHDLPQDMADMTGWKELAQKVSAVYLQLDENERNDCAIFCDNYGQAGAVMFYGKKDRLPQPISLNDSFVFWSPDSLSNRNMIWVHSALSGDIDPETFLPQHFEKVTLKETINNPYFRENGSKIYLCQHPTEQLKKLYRKRLGEERKIVK